MKKSEQLKRFVKDFNFPSPDWDNLPLNFPNLPNSGLTKEEGHLLDGIKLAWMVSEGRNYFVKTVARRAVFAIAIIFVLLAGRNIITGSQTGTNVVSAKTVSTVVSEVVQATMSAVFRK